MTLKDGGFAPLLRRSLAGLRLVAATALIAGAGLGSASAQTAALKEQLPVPKVRPIASDATSARRIDLAAGKSLMIDLPRDAKEVFVADPQVANAVVRTARKIYLIGLKAGSTTVFINDAEGRQIMALDVGVARELTREINILREVIRTALPNAKVDVHGVGQNIVLSGTVDSPLEAQRAVDIANDLVGNIQGLFFSQKGSVVNALRIRGKDQVMLKVTVAEISRAVLKQLGVNFQNSGGWSVGNTALRTVMDNPMAIQRQALSSTNLSAVFGGDKTLDVKAMERNGVLRTLAEPTLTAISGESAKFLAGGEVPVPANEGFDPQTQRYTLSYTYKPVGVSLSFTPIVLSEGRISVHVATEVTELDADNQITLRSGNIPGFRTRRVETTVELPSGGVMATAGLIMQSSRHAITGLPALMNLPILGTMFRSRDYQRNESELMILVQPFIAKPSDPGQIAKPDDGFADPSDPSSVLMNRIVRTYGQGVNRPNPFRGGAGFITD